MNITDITTKEEFDTILKENSKVAVDFYAVWCGPCKMIGPKFEAFAGEYPEIRFIKVNVDENSDTAEAEGISAMPTFRFYLSGEKIDELVGASEEKLRDQLESLESK